jgi:hypothetical protein
MKIRANELLGRYITSAIDTSFYHYHDELAHLLKNEN